MVFFSVITRLQSRKLTPGADVYFAWYVLTKPAIGALGATMLFILARAGFVTSDFGQGALSVLKYGEHGALIFGFSFLAGFSERFSFPFISGIEKKKS